MRRLLSRLLKFSRRDDGLTAVEYAVMLALIIAVCVVAIQQLGGNSRREFRSVSRTLKHGS